MGQLVVKIRSALEATSCPHCQQPAEGRTLRCPGCDTLWHRSCRLNLGHCLTPGCSRADQVRSRPKEPKSVREREVGLEGMAGARALWGIGVFAVLAGVHLGRALFL